MHFKDPDRQREEFWGLVPKLRLILCDADSWAHALGELLTVTCLIRSEEEQRALFEAGKSPDRLSVHQFGRGADLRPLGDDSTSAALLNYLNAKYPYDPARPHMRTASRHAGTADHIHLKVRGDA